jgi:hypothetical protein
VRRTSTTSIFHIDIRFHHCNISPHGYAIKSPQQALQ